VRSIQEKLPTFSSIVDDNGKTAGCSNDEFLAFFVSMTSTFCACRHIVEVVGTPNRERDVAISFNEGEIPPVICNFREIDDATLHNWHFRGSLSTAHTSASIAGIFACQR
jgi:hypothetical protein